MMQRWPQLTASTDLADMVGRLVDSATGDMESVTAAVQAVLTSGSIGLNKLDLSVLPVLPGDGVMFAADRGRMIVRIIRDTSNPEAVAVAVEDVAGAVTARREQTGHSYVALITDGARWRLYQMLAGNCRLVEEKTATRQEPARLTGWIEAIASTAGNISPSRQEIDRALGADSPAHKLDEAELGSIYATYRELPTIRVKRRMWAKLLTTASGTGFADDDSLFINHTLLVMMAKLIGHGVLGIQPDLGRISADELMSGKRFDDAEIEGVIESDFFDWVTEVPEGGHLVMNIARRLNRFDWGNVKHDVLKHLYESIIPRQTRRRLGEYYTPDWLAEKIVADTVTDPLNQRVLDASCGSGTFLFHAIRAYFAAAEKAGKSNADSIRGLVTKVIGIDVQPVAVTLARVTYLLAIGSRRLRNHPAFSVPVYLGDSMRWGQELDRKLDEYEGLSVPTRLDPESFVTGPAPLGFHEFESQLNFPERVVADAERFDRIVARLARLVLKKDAGRTKAAVTAIFDDFDIRAEDRPDLEQTFQKMCDLHSQREDHIWGYYVRNVARPAWLARKGNRVDVLVGNPPWLVYRHMTRAQQKSFKAMSSVRGLWAGGTLATNQDLAGLFVARCIELYLQPGGSFGFVMPWAVLPTGSDSDAGAHGGFRAGTYACPSGLMKVAFEQAWDLHKVKPPFFPLPACVVFGHRQHGQQGAHPLQPDYSEWAGRFDTECATWAEAEPHISMNAAEAVPARGGPSPYSSTFTQGANIVPYFLFNVTVEESGPLGTAEGKVVIRSRRSSNERAPWKDLPPLRGRVEERFIRRVYTGAAIMPFRCLPPSTRAVIPLNEQGLVASDPELLERSPGLANWWREAERVWVAHRNGEGLSLIEQLDFRGKLSRQLPVAGHRVVYGGSVMYMAAAIATDPDAVIEHQLYWGLTKSLAEARFLVAVLNSDVATMAVRRMQRQGEHNPRHVGKKVFRLPIPHYDSRNAAHVQLSALAAHAQDIAGTTSLPDTRFELQRKHIRGVLEREGVTADINAIVKTLLDAR
jgi:SAM-dependent methyltransferase